MDYGFCVQTTSPSIRTVLEYFDSDQDGLVSARELRLALTELDYSVQSQDDRPLFLSGRIHFA